MSTLLDNLRNGSRVYSDESLMRQAAKEIESLELQIESLELQIKKAYKTINYATEKNTRYRDRIRVLEKTISSSTSPLGGNGDTPDV